MSIVRKAIAVAAGSYASLLLGMVQIIILSRVLGPKGVGELALIRQTVLLAVQIATLGLPMAIIGFVNSKRVDEATALRSVCLFGLLTSIFAVAVVSVWWGNANVGVPENRAVYFALAVWIPTVVLRAALYNLLIARLRTNAVIIDVLPLVAQCIWYAVWWSTGRVDVVFCVLSEAAFTGALSLVAAAVLLKPHKIPHPSAARSLIDWGFIRSALPTGIEMISGSVLILFNGYLSLGVLKWTGADFAEVGYFARGLSLATAAVAGMQSLQRLLYAQWSAMDEKRRAQSVERTVNVSVMAAVTIGLVVCVLAKPLTIVILGPSFLPSVPVTRIAIVGVSLFMITRILFSFFNAHNRSLYNVRVLAAGVAINAMVAVMLTPTHQAVGSACALLVSQVGMMCLALSLGIRKFGLNPKSMFVPSPALILSAGRGLRRRSQVV